MIRKAKEIQTYFDYLMYELIEPSIRDIVPLRNETRD